MDIFGCSSCSFVGELPKKERSKARRGEPALCHDCKRRSPRFHGGYPIQCCECEERTYNFSKADCIQARYGNTTSLVCSVCQNAKQEEKRELERAAKRATQKAKFERRLENPRAPWHPHEESPDLTPDATITITSGGICFGFSNDIETGLSNPLSSVKDAVLALPNSGCNNIKARNGVWNAYRIHETYHDGISFSSGNCAWLFCHSDLDPVQEFRYILYHSIESNVGGSQIETATSWKLQQDLHELGILKISRFEWGQWQLLGGSHSDSRNKQLLEEGFQFAEHGKEKDSNSIFTKWHCGGDDKGRVLFDEKEAYALLVCGEHIDFGHVFFPAMYPKGKIPKVPFLYPLGHSYGDGWEDGWPIWDKKDHPTSVEYQVKAKTPVDVLVFPPENRPKKNKTNNSKKFGFKRRVSLFKDKTPRPKKQMKMTDFFSFE